MKLANIIQAFERERNRGNELEAILINPSDYRDVVKDAYEHYSFLQLSNDLVFHYSDVPIYQTDYIQTETILTIHKKKTMKPTLIIGGPASGKTILGKLIWEVAEPWSLRTIFSELKSTRIPYSDRKYKTVIVDECLEEQVKEYVTRIDFDDSINWFFILQDYTGSHEDNRRFNIIKLQAI